MSSSYSTKMLVDAILQNTTRSAPANNAEFEETYGNRTEKVCQTEYQRSPINASKKHGA